MRILRVALLLVHAFVASRLVSGAVVDRYESERPPQHTAFINLLDVLSDRRMEGGREKSHHGVEGPVLEDEEYYDYYHEDEEDASGEYEVELPRVALSTKPKDPSAILEAERSEGKRRRGKGRKKGKGKKRNPCLKKYKDFCIHGSCHYLRDIKAPSCICRPSYSGERCHLFTLASEGRDVGGYSRTTALAVVAVVLSSVCLTIIGLLLVLRFHKRGAYDIEHEEKVKLGSAPNH
ncbi:proheparin-binding EGF-like growth factor [Oncorhynchus keta]|uniref:proheparin-binding EGF-like growth factor n=1 Tax=Oncorhynchus gorbuscha TaxID=8017 RepID=UPI001EAF27DD|nr:proheparin-binding EGF-like growth factor [Oncorhynchus gorbuscha]XP_052370692.1 proheparin-binding EGF-like growth factor [Oncorhynchus keta]